MTKKNQKRIREVSSDSSPDPPTINLEPSPESAPPTPSRGRGRRSRGGQRKRGTRGGGRPRGTYRPQPVNVIESDDSDPSDDSTPAMGGGSSTGNVRM
jgi:hypothetical protein